MALVKRADINAELTWNLADLFATEEEYDQSLVDVIKKAKSFIETHKGKLKSASQGRVLEVVDEFNDLIISAGQLAAYPNLAIAVDHTDPQAQKRVLSLNQVLTPLFGELSFLESELLDLPDTVLASLTQSRYGAFIDTLRQRKPHRFSAETERILAAMSMLSDLPYGTYEAAKLGDLTFPDFTVHGKTYSLSYSLYETVYAESPDTDIRRTAHGVFYDTIARQRQTIAKNYFTEVASQKAMADLRGYKSVFDMLLLAQNVSLDLYDRQIDVLTKELAPVMRRYANKLKANYGLDTLTYADLRLPASPADDRDIEIEEAWDLIYEAMAVMGSDYQAMIRQAQKERWVDFAQNIGKSTGGFCASIHGNHPYILLNWNGRFSEVFTLAHELGHAVQGLISSAHNNALQEDPSLYFIEAPSTIHELLLTNHLLANKDDQQTARTVAGQMVGKTYFHNCVTHLLEAAFQRDVYRAVEAGESLSADDFDRLFLTVLRQFWGDAVDIPDRAGRTWMRQPHYYNGLYPYTYSAGLTVATAVSARIREEGEPAVQDWIETLKRGGRWSPLNLARLAGVDISTDAPLGTMISVIGDLVELI